MTTQSVRLAWMITVAAALLVGLCLPADSAAQEGSDRATARSSARAAKGWWERDGVSEALRLSDRQTAQLQELETAKRELIREARSAEFRAYRELLTAMEDGSAPAAELAAARQTLEDAWLRYAQVSLDHLEQLRAVLTAEQWHELPEVAPRALRMGNLGVRRGKIDLSRAE